LSQKYKYHAFISYSHKDNKWADWLIRSLESFKVPKELIGTKNKDGDEVPSKLSPVFRDREELPTRADLGDVILDSLKRSHYLIVICSPNSSRSMWVNQEIQLFKKLHGEHKVLAIIVDGEPNAFDFKNDPDHEAFPEALRYIVDSEGNLTEQRTEPLAADAREHGDGKERSKVKLAAGLLGVGFNDLWQREKRREKKQRIIFTSIASAVFVTVSALGIFSAIQWQEAEKAKIEEIKQKKIAIENEKLAKKNERLAKKQLIEANHNLGLSYMEKAKKNLNEGWLVQARLYNLKALQKLRQDDNDSISGIINDLNNNPVKFISSSSYKEDNKSEGAVALNFLGTQIAYEDNNTVFIKDIESGKVLKSFTNQDENIYSLAFSNDGSKLALGLGFTEKNEVLIIDLESEEEVNRLKLDFDDDYEESVMTGGVTMSVPIVYSTAFSSDGSKIAIGSSDSTVTVADIKEGKELKRLKGQTGFIKSVAFSPDGTKIASGSENGTIVIWDLKSGEVLNKLIEGGSIGSISFSSDGKELIYGLDDSHVTKWDLENGKVVWKIDGESNSAVFVEDSDKLLSASNDGSVKAWEIESRIKNVNYYQKKDDFGYPTHKINAISPDGKTLLSYDNGFLNSEGGGSRFVFLDAANGNVIQELKFEEGFDDLNDMLFISSDGSKLTINKNGYEDYGENIVIDIKSGNVVDKFKGKNIVQSPDGKKMFSNDHLFLVDANNNVLKSVDPQVFDMFLNSVVFTSEGNGVYFVTKNYHQEDSIKLWNAATEFTYDNIKDTKFIDKKIKEVIFLMD
jgi:WD40 repeat protein